MKKSEIVNAINELNKVMGLEPPIATNGTIAEMREKLVEAAGFITENDKFSKTTMGVLTELGALKEAEETAAVEESETPDTDEVKELESEKDPDDFVETKLVDRVNAVKKLDELRTLVNIYPDFVGLRKQLAKPEFNGLAGYRQLRAAMYEIIGAPASAVGSAKPGKVTKTPKVKKTNEKPDANKFSRTDAAIAAIKSIKVPVTMQDIIISASKIYAEKTGTVPADPKHVNNVPTNMVAALTAFNVLRKENGKYILS